MSDIKVLIVDDEHDFLETLVKRLEKRNFLTQGAENGARALERIEHQPFDVVVLDVMMPEMDGIETLREIKKINSQIEVLVEKINGAYEIKDGRDDRIRQAEIRRLVDLQPCLTHAFSLNRADLKSAPFFKSRKNRGCGNPLCCGNWIKWESCPAEAAPTPPE